MKGPVYVVEGHRISKRMVHWKAKYIFTLQAWRLMVNGTPASDSKRAPIILGPEVTIGDFHAICQSWIKIDEVHLGVFNIDTESIDGEPLSRIIFGMTIQEHIIKDEKALLIEGAETLASACEYLKDALDNGKPIYESQWLDGLMRLHGDLLRLGETDG